ncbi:MAG: putrescine transport system substrate-binding protein [Pseudomonadota bacterium]|nr:putrescine transport system substrate-binding protein [Pseudomonadota bacterium]
MPKFNALHLVLPAVWVGLLSTIAPVHAEETVHLYNWNDYFAENTLEEFQKKTGIRPVLDLYDNNDVLEAKLFAGSSGYDVVFPTARPFGARQIKAGLYQPLDKSKLPGLDQLDPAVMASLKELDPDNAHLVPYLLGTTGLGINVAKVKAALGPDAAIDTWAILFDPAQAAKLKSCGISILDDATEAFAAALAWLGKDPNSRVSDDLDAAAKALKDARKSIRYFHSSQYISDLANGDLCVAHGYSGDILQARSRAEEAAKGVTVSFQIPREGAVLATDVVAIPKDAPNPAAAHAFIAYLLEPAVIADITNHVKYANANPAATPLVAEAVRTDPGIYPTEAVRQKFIVLKTPSDKQLRDLNRRWTRIKAER